MAHVHADGVVDTTTTTGTGALTVSGSAATGFQTFSAVCSTSDTFYYFVRHQAANEWEQGLGTYSASNEITRTTVIKSSNSDVAVNFAAGTKDVFITDPAERDLPRLNGAVADNELISADGTTGRMQGSNVSVSASSTGSVLVDDIENQGPATGGLEITSKDLGTQSSGTLTVDVSDRANQYVINGGAFTLTVAAKDGSCVVQVTNNGSAGAITMSGFQVGSNVGDALDTTNGNDFKIYIDRTNSLATYSIQAMQ